MKLLAKLTLLLILAATPLVMHAARTDYAIGDGYAVERGPSAWDDIPAHRMFEYRLLYLLDTDKAAKDLAFSHPDGLTRQQNRQLSRITNSLDVVLLGAYADAEKLFATHQNPRLLKMMLAHYYLYINSANESWPNVIAGMVKIDEKLAREVSEQAKPRWKNAIEKQ